MLDLRARFEERTRSKQLQEWAKFAKTKTPTLGNWLNGRTRAGEKLLKKVGVALNIDPATLPRRLPIAAEDDLLHEAVAAGNSQARQPDIVIRFILDHMPEEQLRELIDKSLDAGRYEVSRYLVAYVQAKWPSGGMMKKQT